MQKEGKGVGMGRRGLGRLGILEFRPGSEAELGSDDGASAREALDSNLPQIAQQAGSSRFDLWLSPTLLSSASRPRCWKSSCASGRRFSLWTERSFSKRGSHLPVAPLIYILRLLFTTPAPSYYWNLSELRPSWPDINIPSRCGGAHPEGRGYLEHLAKTH